MSKFLQKYKLFDVYATEIYSRDQKNKYRSVLMEKIIALCPSNVFHSTFAVERSDGIFLKKEHGSLLHESVCRKNVPAIKSLLDAHADPNIICPETDGPPLLCVDLKDFNKESHHVLELLLRYGANPNAYQYDHNTLLHKATDNDNTDAVQLLLQYKAHPNTQNRYGDTALHLAIGTQNFRKQKLTLVTMLLENGANPNIQNANQETPLTIRRHEHYPNFLKLLIAYNADLNIQDYAGCTVLDRAMASGKKKNMKILLDAKSDINMVDNQGQTALYRAVRFHSNDIVKMLLDYNADPVIAGPQGSTPLSIAWNHSNYTISRLISWSMAKRYVWQVLQAAKGVVRHYAEFFDA